ncbi:MAG: NADH-quinone oxidoreductase subunit L [Syntrophotalea sp.]|uniref:NADH-quinone oxidoreductase subunit L n=1 Tax=Syntrophotalea sp. TaxID=2812029 RepID=UPI003D0BB9CB
MMVELLFLIPLLPLASALFIMVAGDAVPRRVLTTMAAGAVGIAAALTIWMWPLAADGARATLYTWIESGPLQIPVQILFSRLSATMTLMVTSVSFLIHVYAVSYLHQERDLRRFFSLFNLFVGAMLVIVLADNLLLLFLGWEGVGFCSYALIGYWYRNPEFADAGRKAFLTTRAADVLFGIALLWLFQLTGSLSITAINQQAVMLPSGSVTAVALLLAAGACGKSAQLPFSSWLPDAMAGPTPVSALIHAATMVTAGVYLLCRLFPLISLSPTALAAIGLTGAATAFYAAASALVQRDIKRLLAYSTISQVGYMFLAVGAGTVTGAMFHLLTHAFFKSLMFMAAGLVIHLAGGEQDLYRLGQLPKRAPVLFWLMLAGAVALAGVPPSSGFFSKDAILAACFARATPYWTGLGGLGLLAAFLTALYALRLVYLLIAAPMDLPSHGQAPLGKTWPLLPLSLLALTAGLLNVPHTLGGTALLDQWLSAPTGIAPARRMEWGLAVATCLLVMAAWQLIRNWRRSAPVFTVGGCTRFFASGWRLDKMIRAVLTVPFRNTGRWLQRCPEKWLTLVLPGRLGRWSQNAGQAFRHVTSGHVSDYLSAMLWGTTWLLIMLTALLAL